MITVLNAVETINSYKVAERGQYPWYRLRGKYKYTTTGIWPWSGLLGKESGHSSTLTDFTWFAQIKGFGPFEIKRRFLLHVSMLLTRSHQKCTMTMSPLWFLCKACSNLCLRHRKSCLNRSSSGLDIECDTALESLCSTFCLWLCLSYYKSWLF